MRRNSSILKMSSATSLGIRMRLQLEGSITIMLVRLHPTVEELTTSKYKAMWTFRTISLFNRLEVVTLWTEIRTRIQQSFRIVIQPLLKMVKWDKEDKLAALVPQIIIKPISKDIFRATITSHQAQELEEVLSVQTEDLIILELI